VQNLMRPNEYQDLAMRTEADQAEILRRLLTLGPAAMRLLNGVVGLCNDAGEVCTQVKRHVEYGAALDRVAVLEDCGDVLWRLCQVLGAAGWTLEEAMEANLRKLRARYPDGFTDADALKRNAAAELTAMLNVGEVVNRSSPEDNDFTPGDRSGS
jgi:NTP pyrophosphatase (non-canonical NTP hydrolase)